MAVKAPEAVPAATTEPKMIRSRLMVTAFLMIPAVVVTIPR
ncbi:hypothetical protein [Nocardia fusca]|nr:hypothetical protein [Nocardia fusca]